jgi:acyl carrier protein
MMPFHNCGFIQNKDKYMNHNEFYELLAELLEADESEINGRSRMKDLPNWDSLAVLSFIAMADCELDVVVDATKITDCVTVDDLAALLGNKISS